MDMLTVSCGGLKKPEGVDKNLGEPSTRGPAFPESVRCLSSRVPAQEGRGYGN